MAAGAGAAARGGGGFAAGGGGAVRIARGGATTGAGGGVAAAGAGTSNGFWHVGQVTWRPAHSGPHAICCPQLGQEILISLIAA